MKNIMPTIQDIQNLLERLSHVLPLEIFVAVGSFLEEIIAPIPAPFIMGSATMVALEKNYSWVGFLILAIVGSIGKTVASYVIYFIADKGEDILLGRFGKYFKISHEQLEKIGSLLSKGTWDYVILFFLRALPIAPSFFLSIACGVLKTDMKPYIVSTFFGTIFRNLLLLAISIYGWETIQNWLMQV